jgi:hypothetical protein
MNATFGAVVVTRYRGRETASTSFGESPVGAPVKPSGINAGLRRDGRDIKKARLTAGFLVFAAA